MTHGSRGSTRIINLNSSITGERGGANRSVRLEKIGSMLPQYNSFNTSMIRGCFGFWFGLVHFGV